MECNTAKEKDQPVSVDLIRTDDETRTRAGINQDAVADYFEVIESANGEWPFPPCEVFHDGESYWCSDGCHRIEAARQSNRASIPCVIHKGNARDAFLFALLANEKHGVRRSNADKQYAVRRLLEDPEWGKLKNIQIARMAGVVHQTVANVKAKLNGENANLAIGDGDAENANFDTNSTGGNSTDEASYVSSLSESIQESLKSNDLGLKMSKEELQGLSEYEADIQDEMVSAAEQGLGKLSDMLKTGEIAEETMEHIIEKENKDIDRVGRLLRKTFKDEVPDAPWVQEVVGTALQQVESAIQTLYLGKCHVPCKKCEGEGCQICHETGRLPKRYSDQIDM